MALLYMALSAACSTASQLAGIELCYPVSNCDEKQIFDLMNVLHGSVVVMPRLLLCCKQPCPLLLTAGVGTVLLDAACGVLKCTPLFGLLLQTRL